MGHNPIHKSSTLMILSTSNCLQRPHLLITPCWVEGFSMNNRGLGDAAHPS